MKIDKSDNEHEQWNSIFFNMVILIVSSVILNSVIGYYSDLDSEETRRSILKKEQDYISLDMDKGTRKD